ncbi:MAG: NmrA family NAD(P)-binding protein [Propionibacteriaceae bacterium]
MTNRSSTPKILVTGATGTVGSALVSALHARGADVRAMARDPRSAREGLPPAVPVVTGDFADRASLRTSLQGIDVVFLLCGNVADQVAYECALIDEAQAAGVQRIVKQSARGAAIGSSVAYWHWHALIEHHLHGSGVPAVVLQPGFLMTNLLAAAEHVREQGMLFAPAGSARIAMIDPIDVAAVAAEALLSAAYEGQTLILTGPEAITYQSVADVLSRATGHPVGYVDIPPAAAVPALVDAGLPPFAAEQVVAVFAALRAGAQADPTESVRAVLGRAGGTFAAFAEAHARAFRTPTPASVRA